MTKQFHKLTQTLGAGLLLLAGLPFPPPSHAQQYSDWSAPMNLGSAINSPSNDQHSTISKDGLTLIFISNRPGGFGDFDLYVSQRDSLEDPWQPAVNLAVLNTSSTEFAPNLSSDGHWLYFNRPGGCGGSDIYAAHRTNKRDDFGWEQPINLGCMINTPFTDAGPDLFQDPVTGVLYLFMNRNLLPPPEPDGFDIYVSTCSSPDLAECNENGLWGPAELIPALSSPVRDTRTAIRRRDGLEIILTSSRPGGCGSQDLWVSTRASTADDWSTPVNLDPVDPATGKPTCVTNSSALDGAMALSWDGTTLFFYSNRPGGFGGNDLYMSTRTKLTGPKP